MSTEKITFDDVVQYFGGIDRLAEKLGRTRHAIYMWKGKIPESVAYKLDVLTNGDLSAERMLEKDS